jgi:hypothetical protein
MLLNLLQKGLRGPCGERHFAEAGHGVAAHLTHAMQINAGYSALSLPEQRKLTRMRSARCRRGLR